MSFDPQTWRLDTTAANAGRIHLNNAGASLMPDPVAAEIHRHLKREEQLGGYEAGDAAAADIHETYKSLGALVGSHARNIAIVENATVAFYGALSAFDFRSGDVLLTTKNDYISNQIAYLSLAQRTGLSVVRAEDLQEGGVDPDSVRALIEKHRPKLVALTWVPTNSGLVQDAAAVGTLCADAGVPYLVDACQAVGQIPIDVTQLHCDFLSATARKFLRGPRGIGFLYVSDRMLSTGSHPLYLDMRGARWTDADEFVLADDAKRFENWEFAVALVLGLGEAARYALRADVEACGAYAADLAAYARERLARLPNARVLDRGGRKCAIVTVHFPGHRAHDIMMALRGEAINTTATLREYAVLDMDEKGVPDALRISPHYFNTRREIDIAVGSLEAWGGEPQ
ncbi:MAG: aminotransferase class V-fold PLP-dependent enzyme [Longimicrobiales bacterium]